MGYIYKVINKVNGKLYVGQTKVEIYDRWKGHKSKNSNCTALKNAIVEYGIENFTFKIVCICFDKDLLKFENEYIDKYNSVVPNGYNINGGTQKVKSVTPKVHKCKRCGYTTNLRTSLYNHLKRKRLCRPILADISRENLLRDLSTKSLPIEYPYTCKKCGKLFSQRSNRSAHTKVCNGTNDSEIGKLKQQVKEMSKQVEILQKQIAGLLESNSKSKRK